MASPTELRRKDAPDLEDAVPTGLESTEALPPADAGGFLTRTGMPAWTPRLPLLVFIACAAGSWALDQVGHLSFFIRIIVCSLFVSFALKPAMNWLERHGWRRGLATGLAMLVALVTGRAIVASMVPLVLSEAGRPASQLPHWATQIDRYLKRWFGVTISSGSASSVSAYLKGHFSGWAGNIAGGVFGHAHGALSLVFDLLTIGMFGFSVVAEAPRIRRGVRSLFHPRSQSAILQGWVISISKTGAFLALPAVAIIQAILSTYIHRYDLIDCELLEERQPAKQREVT